MLCSVDILETLAKGVTTRSAQETQMIAAQLAAVIPADHALALYGDLGSGKTTFVQGIAGHWGIEQPITSPTFAIFNIYQGVKRNLVHLDAYRLEGADAAEDLMLEEFMESPWCLIAEWPDRFPDLEMYPHWKLQFNRLEHGVHHISRKSTSENR